MRGKQLSAALRVGSGLFLQNRRGIVGLSLAAASSMGLIGLYQTGLIRHLPEPPLPSLDADRVDASPEAYEKLETPDALLGLVSYATTAALAGAGAPDRARTHRWLPLMTAGKVALDATQALKLTYDQWSRHRAYCSWCLLATGATLAMLPLALPEALAALRPEERRPRRLTPASLSGR